MHGITIRTTQPEGHRANTAQMDITVEGDGGVLFQDLRFELAACQTIKAVGTVYAEHLDIKDMEGRLECEIGGRRCVIVPIDEIEKRAGHSVFARAFRRILGFNE